MSESHVVSWGKGMVMITKVPVQREFYISGGSGRPIIVPFRSAGALALVLTQMSMELPVMGVDVSRGPLRRYT
jgi:hypothetical protein